LFTDSSRYFISAIAASLAIATGFSAAAQQQQGAFQYVWADRAPIDAITGADIHQALIWTGYFQPASFGEADGVRKAAQAWQAAKRYKLTDVPTPEQAVELVYDGLRIRDGFGWATMRDDGVGFSIGIPTKLTKFEPPRNEGAAVWYRSQGAVAYTLGIKYANASCTNMPVLHSKMNRAFPFLVRRGDSLIGMASSNERAVMIRMACHPAGLVSAQMEMPVTDLATKGVLLSAMVNSLELSRNFNPTAPTKPRVVALAPAPASMPSNETARVEAAAAIVPPGVDTSGKTTVKMARREGGDLRADQVFEKASGAVYVVRADNRQGSAVAIGERELLTNCHVVGSRSQVSLRREKQEIAAKVVSMNAAADRCVLRTESKLAKWVGVRPYADIKVGERALSIGTPFGFELTLAEGVVSSKREHKGVKLVQTSAPISQGSSGGGLFDAEGHLIGITTFQMRLGQNLNFAVAAEEFARPN
jgi:S1-C subfamily serine protease